MVWLMPVAWLGAAAVVAPVLIHLLIQQRARTVSFPTLRFLTDTRVAATRRHSVDDWILLAVRCSVVVAAVEALAGPLLVTRARHAAWDSRTVRAFVGSKADIAAAVPRVDGGTALQRHDIETDDLRDGIARAVDWLETAPPARREIVVAAPLVQGTIDSSAVSAVPRGIGIRLVRVGTVPEHATVDGGVLLSSDATRQRTISLDGPWTSVADHDTADQRDFPVTVIAAPSQRRAADAAIAAVRSLWIPAPARGRRARLVIASEPVAAPAPAAVVDPWMADAVAALVNDSDLQASATRVSAAAGGVDLARQPWIPIAQTADGRVVVAGASVDRDLLVASVVPGADVLTPVLLRALARALAPAPSTTAHDILPVPDDDLRAWERSPAPVGTPTLSTVIDDDRRWFWGMALALLAIETAIRRRRSADAAPLSRTPEEDHARVA